jgi:ABC-type multidrug transport system ATPase subunit
MPALAVHELTRRFGTFTAVDRASFRIERGELFGLLGPNGSGKSTIIRMLCGLLRPTSGQAEVDGVDVVRHPDRVKPRIGYMSQRFSLYRDLTVHENLQFYGQVYGLRGVRLRERRTAVVELLGLHDYLGRLAGLLSGGWQQRLALACALLHEPSVVFLDEPTAGIDPVARRQLWDLLFELSAGGTTFLVTTHYMDEAERCTQVAYLYLSKLVSCGKPAELKALPIVHPSGTRWLRLESPQSSRAYVLLRKTPGVLRATIFGEALHLLVEETLDPARLFEMLRANGLSAMEPAPVEPSLEDVFVALTEHQAARPR